MKKIFLIVIACIFILSIILISFDSWLILWLAFCFACSAVIIFIVVSFFWLCQLKEKIFRILAKQLRIKFQTNNMQGE